MMLIRPDPRSSTNKQPLPLPPILQAETTLLASVMDQLHETVLGLLDALSQISHDAGLNISTSLARKHRLADLSTTCKVVQRYPSFSAEDSNAGLGPHTDVGSLAFLL
ncbi:hypothetical protein H9L39_08407 [Fusarium oxysporum f. sp. albedinis]|nr:hypothetical protein H9L39_08407 [Fusarium oxysporum f. sp. albedinis]